MWLVALPAVGYGLINVLGPLRLHRLSAGAAAVGVTYLASAALEGAVSPTIGRLSDRRGRLLPLRLGLAAATVLMMCFSLPRTPVLLAVTIVAIAAGLGAFWAPAMAMLSDSADADRARSGPGGRADEPRMGRRAVASSIQRCRRMAIHESPCAVTVLLRYPQPAVRPRYVARDEERKCCAGSTTLPQRSRRKASCRHPDTGGSRRVAPVGFVA